MARNRMWAAYLLGASFLPSALFAQDLPTDPTVVAGQVDISTPSQDLMLMQQASQYGIVDWGGFSIGQGFGVRIENGSGTTLNRVTGGAMSSILGSLTATGSVYLVNPNGIVIGRTGVISTGGRFVASALDMTDADLMNGGDTTFAGVSPAYVVNLGQVSSLGGDVALIARNVSNEGSLSAPEGTVGVIAGREVLMRDAALDDGLFAVRVGGSDTSASDAGTIRAAAAELRARGGNVYALAGNTQGTIEATGVAKVKGRVFLTADDGGKLTVDKTVTAKEASGAGGKIVASGGTVDLSGTLDASGTSGGEVRVKGATETDFSGMILATGGDGFVEVSGAHLSFSGDVQTAGGTLLIDPDNIEISDGNGALLLNATVFSATGLATLLGTQDVILETASSATEAGTILVTNSVEWSSAFSLTLLAQGDVVVNGSLINDGATGGDVNLIAGWDGTTAFDAATFDAAALAGQSLFGSASNALYILNGARNFASGSVLIGDGQQFYGVDVGARAGTTRVYGNDLSLRGATFASGFGGFAQLGYTVFGTGTVTPVSGDISVRTTGNVSLIAGSSSSAPAQIGHGGVNMADVGSPADASLSGNITLESLGNLLLQGGSPGSDAGDYAMIGHGSRDFASFLQTTGDRSGAITLSFAGEVSVQQGDGFRSNGAWIGHTTALGAISGADLTLTAAAFDQSASSAVGSGGTGNVDVEMLSEATEGGDVRVTTTDSALSLMGSTGTIACDCSYVTTPGALIVQTSGDLILDTSFQYSNLGGGALILASGNNIANNAGALAIGTMKGQYVLYSDRPDQDTGTLNVIPTQLLFFDTAFDPANPISPFANENVFVYRQAPVITVASAAITYGGTYAPGAVTMTVNGTGEVIADPNTWGFAIGTPAVDPLAVTVSADGFVNAGTHLGALKASVAGTGSFNPSSYFVSWGDLTVNRAVVTVTLGDESKVYDAVGGYTAGASYAGWVGTDTAALITAGPDFTYAGGDGSGVNAGSYLVSASGLAESSGNYSFDTTDTATLTISPRALSAELVGNPTKTYDGTTTATLTGANFLLSGFAGSEGASVTQTSGAYDSANAGSSTVTADLTGQIVAASGTLLSNYILPVTALGIGSIDQATLTASVIGNPTKTYDGTTTATLGAGNFLLSGFVGLEGASINQTLGTYASANAGVSTVTADLTGQIVANEGTLLSNYILPVTASGNGTIGQATLTASLIGNPTKTYDGTTTATLGAGNFLLSGFIGNQGARVTQTLGSYANANAGGSTVTADLTGQVVADAGTRLSNYLLPATAQGAGTIDTAQLSVSIVGLPNKPFDGTSTATLTSANFLLSGFVAGEGATIQPVQGSFDSTAAGLRQITTSLSPGDYLANGGTNLANYSLPASASGQGLIGTLPVRFTPPATRGLDPFVTTPLGYPTGPADVLQTIDTETTQRILDEINAGAQFCRQFVGQEYAIDCLSDRLQSVADGLSTAGEYSEVRAALEDAAQKLHAIALRNASSVLEEKVARSPNRSSSRPLTAIRPDALAAANAEATAVIVNTQLVLLRSASNSERRRAAFEQVSQVVGSTKVLLRSS